jgi:VanZ family protein
MILPASRFKRFHLPALLWALLIYISSSIPSVSLPAVRILNADKVVHFLVFLVLAWLLDRSLRNVPAIPWVARYHLALTVVLTTVYGALDEVHQAFVPGRNPSFLDLSADVGGALLYVAIVWFLGRRRGPAPEV